MGNTQCTGKDNQDINFSNPSPLSKKHLEATKFNILPLKNLPNKEHQILKDKVMEELRERYHNEVALLGEQTNQDNQTIFKEVFDVKLIPEIDKCSSFVLYQIYLET
jgi:hypothetical protein